MSKDEFEEERSKGFAYTKSDLVEYPVKEEILRVKVAYGEEGLDYDFERC